jgi:hypothetical protein
MDWIPKHYLDELLFSISSYAFGTQERFNLARNVLGMRKTLSLVFWLAGWLVGVGLFVGWCRFQSVNDLTASTMAATSAVR